MLSPRNDLAALVSFLHGNVRHKAIGCGAVPVLLAGFDVDHIAGTNLLNFTASASHQTDAVSHV